MRKSIPLCIAMVWGFINAYGQAPSLQSGYQTYILTTEGRWETLGTTVSGAQPMTYYWQKDGEIIPGEESYLQLEWVTPADAGEYRLTATNTYGTATSDPIVVEVAANTPPVADLRTPTPGTTFTPGTEFYFGGYGSDLENGTSLTHTWRMDYHDGTTVTPGPEVAYQEWIGDGESAGYFHLPPDLVPSAGAFYRLYFTVEDYYGLTDTETIDIPWSGQLNTSPPEIEEHPEDIAVDENTPVTFSVNARFATSYQWTFEGVNIPGATGSTYHLISAQPDHAGTYRVLVSNAAGTTESNEAELTVRPAPGNAAVFKTNPSGLLILQSGAQRTTPYTVAGEPGTAVNIGPYTQTFNGVEYTFSNWGHGGSPVQNFTVPTGKKYYTINYSKGLGFGPWRSTEIGGVNLQGSETYNNGTFTLHASGNDIWSIIDACRFVYQSYSGDVDIRARVTGLTNTHPWAKAGIMIRNSNDPKAMNVMMLISASNGASFQHRYKHGEITSAKGVAAAVPSWIRIVRSGNTFTGYVSSDGTDWTPVGTPLSLPMNARVFIGLAATSHNTGALTTATFTNVSVSAPAALAARSEAEFGLYPNPAVGNTLQVLSSPARGARKLEIVNVFGKVVHHQTLLNEAESAVDIQSIPQGVYIVRLSDKGRVETRSLIRK